MGLIEYYLLFAFSTSFTAWYLWFWPLMRKAKADNISNQFTKYPILSSVIYILVSAIISPILVIPLLSSTHAEAFERGLATELLKQD